LSHSSLAGVESTTEMFFAFDAKETRVSPRNANVVNRFLKDILRHAIFVIVNHSRSNFRVLYLRGRVASHEHPLPGDTHIKRARLLRQAAIRPERKVALFGAAA
jgi:hypothetical protein